jgi:hypothetical protein
MVQRAASLTALALGLAVAAGQAVRAQGAPAPISQATLQSYIDVVSINMCTLLKQNVAYPTVYQSGVSTIAAVVIKDNGSMIQGVNNNQPLSNDQVFNGTAVDLAEDNANRCPSLIPPAELQRLQNYVKANKKGS